MYTIYSRDNCGYCTKAKSLLETNGLLFEEVEASTNRDILIERVVRSGHPEPRTVPQIFQGDTYIGGYMELQNSLNK